MVHRSPGSNYGPYLFGREDVDESSGVSSPAVAGCLSRREMGVLADWAACPRPGRVRKSGAAAWFWGWAAWLLPVAAGRRQVPAHRGLARLTSRVPGGKLCSTCCASAAAAVAARWW